MFKREEDYKADQREIGREEVEHHKRRRSDTLIGSAKERSINILLNHGPLGVFALVLIAGGSMYFRNAERRYEQFIQSQNETNVALQETNKDQNRALMELNRESSRVISKVTEVMERVDRKLSREDRSKPPDWPEQPKKPTLDLEMYK